MFYLCMNIDDTSGISTLLITELLNHKSQQHSAIHYYYYDDYFYTPGSKGSLGLITKGKNVARMAIGPGNQYRISRAKALS